jgi:hypothetical protein
VSGPTKTQFLFFSDSRLPFPFPFFFFFKVFVFVMIFTVLLSALFTLSHAVSLSGTAFYTKPFAGSDYGEDVFAAYSVNDQGQLKLHDEIPFVPMRNQPLGYFHVHFSMQNSDTLVSLQCDAFSGQDCSSAHSYQTQTYTISTKTLTDPVPVVFNFSGSSFRGDFDFVDLVSHTTQDGVSYVLFSSGLNISGSGDSTKIFSFNSTTGQTKEVYSVSHLPDTVSSYSTALSSDEKTLFFVYESNSFIDPTTLSGQGIFVDTTTGNATAVDYSFPIVNFTFLDSPVITGPNSALLRRRIDVNDFADFVPLTAAGLQEPILKLPVAEFSVALRGAAFDDSSSTYYTAERL